MATPKIEAAVVEAATRAGLETARFCSGASPYSRFDLLVFPTSMVRTHYGGCVSFDDSIPATYTVVGECFSKDPTTAYKGRVGRGRVIKVTPCEGGHTLVSSQDEVVLTLADGSSIGHKKVVAFDDLWG